MMETAFASKSGKTGWDFVHAEMEKQIQDGRTTLERYMTHFRERSYMTSLGRYSRWVADHPGVEVPRHINSIRTDRELIEDDRRGPPV